MALPEVVMEVGVVYDPEIRFGANGNAWMALRCVAKDRKKDSSGTWTDGEPTFLDVKVFGKLAENVAESVQKGDLILVAGRASLREWTDKEGTTRQSLEVAARHVGTSLTFHPARPVRSERSAPAAPGEDPWAPSASEGEAPF